MGDVSYAASPPSRKVGGAPQRKREGFRPPLSRVAGLLPRLDGLVTSPRLPVALKFLRTGLSSDQSSHISTRTLGACLCAANATLVLTLTADWQRQA